MAKSIVVVSSSRRCRCRCWTFEMTQSRPPPFKVSFARSMYPIGRVRRPLKLFCMPRLMPSWKARDTEARWEGGTFPGIVIRGVHGWSSSVHLSTLTEKGSMHASAIIDMISLGKWTELAQSVGGSVDILRSWDLLKLLWLSFPLKVDPIYLVRVEPSIVKVTC